MITIKEGKNFKKSFLVYTCKRCGFEGFMAANEDVINHKFGVRYSDDMYTKKTEHIDGYTCDHTICPHCENTIGHKLYSEERDKEYIKKLLSRSVTLANGIKTVLTIDDLFY